jgi:hypothetical protein
LIAKYSVGAGKNIIFVAGNGVFLHNNVKAVIFLPVTAGSTSTREIALRAVISSSNCGKYFYSGK